MFIPHPLKWDRFLNSLFFFLQRSLSHFSAEHPRSYSIYINIMPCPFYCQILCKLNNSSLTSRISNCVCHFSRSDFYSCSRCQIDDLSEFLLYHMFSCCFTH